MVISRFTHNGDVRIHYLDSGGNDHGVPIVFVPGMTDIADDYTEVMPLFGRRAVVVEIRGHGKSAAPDGGYDLASLSADVGAVVDAVTNGPVHVMTFSRERHTRSLGPRARRPRAVVCDRRLRARGTCPAD